MTRPVSRRQQFSQATRQALVSVAGERFAEQGYAATSLDAIVAGAQVTKGALYHHFSGKQALFEAVFVQIETDAAERIRRSIEDVEDPWAKADAGLQAFLDVVSDPAYRRIVVQEGPAVLGYERFREQEERSSYASVRRIVSAVMGSGAWRPDEAMVDTFTQIFFGALSAAGDTVSSSTDPAAAIDRVRIAVGAILAGLRGLVESGPARLDD